MALNYKKNLIEKMNNFVHAIFDSAYSFPKEEIYITTAQLKRASLSIVLNYTEGYARFKRKVQLNFLEISYGSLKETEYLLEFSFRRNFLNEDVYKNLKKQVNEIGAMLWTEINSLSKTMEE